MIAVQGHAGAATGAGRIPAAHAGTAVAVASIWISVAFTSLFAPDLIHGSDQDHLALAAIFAWMWGAIATAFVLVPLSLRHDERTQDAWWYALAALTGGIWVAVALVSIFTPREVTGSDPTQNPVGAMIAPIAGMIGTGFLAGCVAIFARGEKRTLGTRPAEPAAAASMQARFAGTAVALLGIWIGVLLTSLFSPDLIHSADREHTPIAAYVTWFWGVVATGFVLLPLALRRHDASLAAWWRLLAIVTVSIWVAVALVSVFSPRYVAGADPSEIPFGAILAPMAGMTATGFLAWFIVEAARGGPAPAKGGAP
jgi:hypothetical protein